ncbi:MAG: dTDP-4-dehydrorhamnose 3,5-epimerase [Nitrosotalea sp.]
MIFTETKLKSSFIIEIEKVEDERGFFARSWDKKIFEERGLNSNLVQCDISFNKKKGTIRGLHYQISPYEEAKLVRCTKGKVFEVMIDLRPKSETFMSWFGIELNACNYKMLYVPEGFALGLQTLEDNTELFYQMSQIYMPEYSRGILWNDEIFRITWPLKSTVISKKDLSYTPFKKIE